MAQADRSHLERKTPQKALRRPNPLTLVEAEGEEQEAAPGAESERKRVSVAQHLDPDAWVRTCIDPRDIHLA